MDFEIVLIRVSNVDHNKHTNERRKINEILKRTSGNALAQTAGAHFGLIVTHRCSVGEKYLCEVGKMRKKTK